MKVCSLSRGVMFQHLSNPLQTGIRFFPSSHTRYTIGSPCGYLPVYHGSISGLPCSVCVTTDDLGLALFTGDRFVHDRKAGNSYTVSQSHFGSSLTASLACST